MTRPDAHRLVLHAYESSVTGHAATGKSGLLRFLAVVAGEPVITVRMSDGLVHAATRGELWCTGVAAPTVGSIDGVITCFQCIVDVAQVEAMKGLAVALTPRGTVDDDGAGFMVLAGADQPSAGDR